MNTLLYSRNTMISRYSSLGGTIMIALKFVALTWLTSFITAAYCQMDNSSSESNCTITIFEGPSPSTPVREFHSKMIDSCPENYENEDILTRCEHINDGLDGLDNKLFTPTINYVTNITYMNKFCATCNNDNDTKAIGAFAYWTSFTSLEYPCDYYGYTSKIKASEINDLDKWTQTFISNGMSLETRHEYYDRKLQCSRRKEWPINLLRKVIGCLVSYLEIGQNERLISCKYFEKNGRSCNQMEFIVNGFVFEYRSRFARLTEINLTGGDYVVQTENTDAFYMCKQIYNPGYWGKILLNIVSMTFLCIHLILNFHKKYFQIWQYQFLYVYSIGLIVMYALFIYMYLKFPVSNVPLNLAKIFWTYHFLWTTLILTVFCHKAFCTCNECKNLTNGTPLKNNLSTVLILFGLALTISLPLMYLHFLESHENQCPPIPGHFAVSDVPAENLHFLKLIVNLSLSFFMPAIIVVGIIFLLIARSLINSPPVFVKMLSFVGIHWILYKRCTECYESENSYTVRGSFTNMDMMAQLSIDIHGVLVFLVFLPYNRLIDSMLSKFGCEPGNDSQQGDDGAIETTT